MSRPAASTLRTRLRPLPVLTASALSLALYTAHTHLSPPIQNDSAPASSSSSLSPLPNKPKAKPIIPASALPYVPLVWGSNRFLTLSDDSTLGQVKKPTPLVRLGASPYRDVVLAERYGAAVDARGDVWMWGAEWDAEGGVGASLKGKNIRSITATQGKLYCLSASGRLYALSASRAAQSSRTYRTEQSWWSYLFSSDPRADFVEITAPSRSRSERITGVSAGQHHLLAVTSTGRALSLPLSERANSHRQLGTRQSFDAAIAPVPGVPGVGSGVNAADSPLAPVAPAADPRFCTTLTPLPALEGVTIDQVTASALTSFARTRTGRVLGWGANESGQIGLGPTAIVDVVPTPVEVVLARNYPGGTTLKCLDVVAGGNTTMFVVQRDTPGKEGAWVDLLACGNGMTGALGNGLWSSASPSPVRVKTVSGLQEYSEKVGAFIPLSIYSVSVAPSPAAHVFAVLDTVREAEDKGVKRGLYGMDVMVWGGNADYQLGNGKRSSLAVPQHLPPLVARAVAEDGKSVIGAVGLGAGAGGKEAGLSSGTLSPMPHSRLQLHRSKAHAYDPEGRLIRRNVTCEEVVVAGWNASVLYNKIID